MANSLFDERLRAAHLGAGASAAGALVVQRLIYPHRREALLDVAALLAGTLSAGGPVR